MEPDWIHLESLAALTPPLWVVLPRPLLWPESWAGRQPICHSSTWAGPLSHSGHSLPKAGCQVTTANHPLARGRRACPTPLTLWWGIKGGAHTRDLRNQDRCLPQRVQSNTKRKQCPSESTGGLPLQRSPRGQAPHPGILRDTAAPDTTQCPPLGDCSNDCGSW